MSLIYKGQATLAIKDRAIPMKLAECAEGRNKKIQLICVDRNCRVNSKLCCTSHQCKCFKAHQQCHTYNFPIVNQHIDKTLKNWENLFNPVLQKIQSTITALSQLYNSILQKKYKYLQPSELVAFRVWCQNNGKVNSEQTTNLYKLYSRHKQIKIPELAQLPEYNKYKQQYIVKSFDTADQLLQKFSQQINGFYHNYSSDNYAKQIEQYLIRQNKKYEKKNEDDVQPQQQGPDGGAKDVKMQQQMVQKKPGQQ